MYSVILMMAATTAQDVPQGVFLNRGGCTGVTVGTPVRTAAALVRGTLATVRTKVAERPRLLLTRTTGGVGCAGTTARVSTTTTTVVQRLPVAAVGSPSVAFVGPVRKAIVAKQLRKALEQSSSPTAKKALADPDVFDAAVAKVTREMHKAAVRAGAVGVIGDGTILQKILDNLPAILAAIKQIIDLFG